MIEYRRANDDDWVSINEFHRRIGGKDRSFSEWEFIKGPQGHSVYVIAVLGSRVVGANAVIPIETVGVDGEIFLTGKSEDTLVDPEFRGQNIFKRLYEVLFEECRREGIRAIWGYTPAEKPFLKIGFGIPFHHSQSILVFKVFSSFRYLNGKNPGNSLRTWAKIFGLCLLSRLRYARRPNPGRDIRVEVIESPHDILKLFEDRDDFPPRVISIRQSPSYVKWRYSDNPYLKGLQHLIFKNPENQLLAGAIVNTTTDNVCYVSHMAFQPGLPFSTKTKIVSSMAEMVKKQGAAAIRNWHFPGNSYNREETLVFQKASFHVLNRGVAFVWKDLISNPIRPEHFVLSRASTQGLW